jgi:hypothetical protein
MNSLWPQESVVFEIIESLPDTGFLRYRSERRKSLPVWAAFCCAARRENESQFDFVVKQTLPKATRV